MVLLEGKRETQSAQVNRAEQRLLELMDAEDRELLTLWAQGIVSTRALGRVLGRHSSTVARRLKRLRTRMADPAVRAVVIYERGLPPRYREVALRVLCRGEPIARVSRALSMKLRETKALVTEIRGWARACAGISRES